MVGGRWLEDQPSHGALSIQDLRSDQDQGALIRRYPLRRRKPTAKALARE